MEIKDSAGFCDLKIPPDRLGEICEVSEVSFALFPLRRNADAPRYGRPEKSEVSHFAPFLP